jgi:TIR domain
VSDVFISYAGEDKPKAKLFAKALGQQGLSVWWDRDIPLGKSYGQVIAQALDSAKWVVVLWSKKAVVSDWVKDEAEEGKRRRILVPALIQNVTPPIGFGQLQTANLVRWKGDGAYPDFQQFLEAVRMNVGQGGSPTKPIPTPTFETDKRPTGGRLARGVGCEC